MLVSTLFSNTSIIIGVTAKILRAIANKHTVIFTHYGATF
jgi:hypothetical protein